MRVPLRRKVKVGGRVSGAVVPKYAGTSQDVLVNKNFRAIDRIPVSLTCVAYRGGVVVAEENALLMLQARTAAALADVQVIALRHLAIRLKICDLPAGFVMCLDCIRASPLPRRAGV